MTIRDYWLNKDRYLLKDAAYLVCGLEPQASEPSHKDPSCPVIVANAFDKIRWDNRNDTSVDYLLSCYYINRDELYPYAVEFGGETVADALVPNQKNLAIVNTESKTSPEKIRTGAYHERDKFALAQLESNSQLGTLKPKAKLFKELNRLAESLNLNLREFNKTWWIEQKIFPKNKATYKK